MYLVGFGPSFVSQLAVTVHSVRRIPLHHELRIIFCLGFRMGQSELVQVFAILVGMEIPLARS